MLPSVGDHVGGGCTVPLCSLITTAPYVRPLSENVSKDLTVVLLRFALVQRLKTAAVQGEVLLRLDM
jgi:hypothetical protein